MSARILIVEDEEKLARFIELELKHEDYDVTKSMNGREALEIALQGDFDLVLLDIMLPGINGLEVLRRLKAAGNETPVILLTARDAVMDKVSGLDAGAVDYVTKPFAIEELLARIRVALKMHPVIRTASADLVQMASPDSALSGETMRESSASAGAPKEEGIYTWENLRLDERRHRVTYGKNEITLTNREFLMLKELLSNQDIVLSRDTLLNKVCGYDYIGETNIVDVYIRYLRAKIDDVFGVKMIQTVRGVGYVIKAE